MSSVSPNPSLVTRPARATFPSISALVTRVVACTTGARTSRGSMPARCSALRTPRVTPSRGRDGVLRVLSTTTRPVSPSSSTTSVNVPPMSTATLQSAIPVFLPDGAEDVHDPDFAVPGVADEPAVAVGQVLRRVIDVARPEHDALVRPDPEVELPGDDEPELLVLGVTAVRRRPPPVLDPPEGQAQVLAVEHPAAHAFVDLPERAVVKWPDVRVRRRHAQLLAIGQT